MSLTTLLRTPIRSFSKMYLLAAIAVCCVSCGPQLDQKDKAFLKEIERTQNAERKIIIPKIADTSSFVGHIRHQLPYSYMANPNVGVDILADTTRLCIKGDSCWLEYQTTTRWHIRQKNGSDSVILATNLETSDPVLMK